MIRAISVVVCVALCSLAVFALADNPATGQWNCVSKDERGVEVAWTLAVADNAGKLSGSITLAQSGDKLEILEPSLDGNTFTFKIQISKASSSWF